MTKSFQTTQLISLKDKNWLDKQILAGKCAAACISKIKQIIADKTPNVSLKDLEREALDIMEKHNCSPTFKGYKGFPGAICTSVNNQLVHGIPSDYILKEGDVVKVDLGTTYDGVIADTATTAIYGQPKSKDHVELLETGGQALDAAIKAIAVGKQLGVIGNAISHVVKKTRFSVITTYGGHGISKDTPHDHPFVANKGRQDEGIRIQPGLVIAIEPMITIGDNRTIVGHDGWTVMTGGINCHFEKTVFVEESGPIVIT